MRHLLAAAVIVMSGAGAAGCGDSIEEPARPQSSTVSSSPPASSAPRRALDRRAARAALLPPPALPLGFIALADDDQSNESDASKLDRCEAQRMKRTASAYAEIEFSHDDEGNVGEVVYLLPNAVQARWAVRSLTDSSARKCYVRVITARLQDAGYLVGGASTRTAQSDRVGADTSSFRVTAVYAKAGPGARLTVDAVVFRVGRAVASLYFLRVGSAFNETLRTDLSSKAFRVMNRALRQSGSLTRE